jgi:hypothetical protein
MRAAAALAMLAIACGGGRGADEPAAARTYPGLARVPADATWVVAARTGGELAEVGRELLEPVAIANLTTVDLASDALRGALGVSPLAADELEAAGVGRGGAAIYGDPDGGITLLFAIDDRARFATARAARGAAWVEVGGWLAIHVGAAPDRRWQDALAAARGTGGVAGADDVAALIAGAAPDGTTAGPLAPSVVGRLRPAALAAVGEGAPCLAALAGAVEGVSLRASLGDGAVGVAIELAPHAAAALAAGLGPAARPGLVAARADAAFHASVALDVSWLRDAIAGAGCSEPGWLEDPLVLALGGRAARAYHVVVDALDPDELDGRGLAQVALRDDRAIGRALDDIPGRSWFERDRTIAGVEVRELAAPGVPRLAYRLAPDELLVAVGGGQMARLLAPGDPAAGPREVASLALAPPRLPALGAILALAGDALGAPLDRRVADELARRLRRYAELGVRARLDGSRLTIVASRRLASPPAAVAE